MLLQRLIELADRLEEDEKLAPPLYKERWARYVIELDEEGHLLNPQPIDLSKAEKGRARGQPRVMPNIVRSRAVKPLLLADHAEYTLGLGREKTKPERVKKCHQAYLDLLEACVEATQDPVVKAVYRFLDDDPLDQLELGEDFDRSGAMIFRVDDQLVHQRRSVREFWVDHHAPKPKNGKANMQCLICGEEKPTLKRLTGKIKGIPGGHSVGTAIISANENAYESYGLEASHIAPTCIECGDRFTKALNYLLNNDSNHVWFSNLIFVFWTSHEVTFDFGTFIQDPQDNQVRELIQSIRSGKRQREVDETSFYAVSLSGSGGRAVVRDWIGTTVGKVKASLARWFEAQAVVDAWGEPHRPLGVYALAGATVRDLKDVPPPTYRELLRSGLSGTPLPWNLLQKAVGRSHAERDVTRSRAALIKLVMTTQSVIKENDMVQLQTEHPETGYHCGRLLAVLESIQRNALGDINATIVDRFYGTASTAPASVFGRLLRGAQPHLSKLRRDRPGAGHALQQRLEEVLTQIPAFPHTLDLKQQGFFALGYYHQRAYDRAQARAHSELKATSE
jgi:CRISPR-associated protein Csd1